MLPCLRECLTFLELKATQAVSPLSRLRKHQGRESRKMVKAKGREISTKIHLPDMTQLQLSQTLQLWLPEQNWHNIGPMSTFHRWGRLWGPSPPRGTVGNYCWRDDIFFSGVATGSSPGWTKFLLLLWQVAQGPHRERRLESGARLVETRGASGRGMGWRRAWGVKASKIYDIHAWTYNKM